MSAQGFDIDIFSHFAKSRISKLLFRWNTFLQTIKRLTSSMF